MNKTLISALVLASALAAPAFAFAQSNNDVPPTRAEVKAELVQLEKAGYNPASNDVHYPDALLAAQARVNALQGVATSAYGPSTSGTSAAGVPARLPVQTTGRSLYSGH
jgi:Domain of unknown function (DUF4148)